MTDDEILSAAAKILRARNTPAATEARRAKIQKVNAAREPKPCTCGRTSLRLSPLIGRKKQMIKFKGTTLYPPALFVPSE